MRFGDRVKFDNPPGFMWLLGGAFKLFGMNDFAAAWPAAVAGVLGVVGTFCLFELLFSAQIGFLAAVVLTLTSVYLKYSRHAMMDSVVAALGVWCFYFFLRGMRGSPRWYILAGLAGSYIFFCKSLFGVFPIVTLTLYLLLSRQFFPFKRWELWLALVLLFIPYGAWIWNQYQIFGHDFMQGHFYNLLLSKASHGGSDDHFYDYAVVLLKYFPIWLPFMLFGLWRSLRARDGMQKPHWFVLIFFLVYFVLLSIQGTTKTWYFLPALPACAGLAALGLDPVLRRFAFEKQVRVIGGIAGVVFLLFTLTNVPLNWDRPFEKQIRFLSPYVRAATDAGFGVMSFRFEFYSLNNPLLWSSGHQASIAEKPEAMPVDPGKVVILVPVENWAELQARVPGLRILKKTEEMILAIHGGDLATETVF